MASQVGPGGLQLVHDCWEGRLERCTEQAGRVGGQLVLRRGG